MIPVFTALLLSLLPVQDRPATADDPDLVRSVQRIGNRWAQVRGEAFDRPPRVVRSPDEMTDVAVEARAYRVVPPQRLEARGRSWNDVGLGGPASPTLMWLTLAKDLPGIDLDPAAGRLLVSPTRLTEGDYGVTADHRIYVPDGTGTVHELRLDDADVKDADPGSGDFLLITGVRPDEPLLAHYLTHLRQFERYGQDSIRETTDGLLAASAWAEGEANLVSLYFLFQGIGLVRTVLTGPLGPGDFLDGQLIPEAVRTATPMDASLLRFVYEDGYDYVADRWRQQGWQVFAEQPPRSTRALLYPERPAEPVVWPAAKAPQEGLELHDTDRLGPQAILSLVSLWTGSAQTAFQAARGWVGDRLTRWERTPDDGVTVWETRWENAAAAQAFEEAFRQVIRRRDPKVIELTEPPERAGLLVTRFREFRILRDATQVRIEIRAVEH